MQRPLNAPQREEALRRLDQIKALRQEYMKYKTDFENFAMAEWQGYRDTKSRIHKFTIACIVLYAIALPLYVFLPKEQEDFAAIFIIGGTVCMLVAALTRTNPEETTAMVAKYLEKGHLPAQDVELAKLVFSDASNFSDLPDIKRYLDTGALTKKDLAQAGLTPGFDYDPSGLG